MSPALRACSLALPSALLPSRAPTATVDMLVIPAVTPPSTPSSASLSTPLVVLLLCPLRRRPRPCASVRAPPLTWSVNLNEHPRMATWTVGKSDGARHPVGHLWASGGAVRGVRCVWPGQVHCGGGWRNALESRHHPSRSGYPYVIKAARSAHRARHGRRPGLRSCLRPAEAANLRRTRLRLLALSTLPNGARCLP